MDMTTESEDEFVADNEAFYVDTEHRTGKVLSHFEGLSKLPEDEQERVK